MNTIAVDTETGGLRWWLPNEQAFLATVSDATNDSLYVQGEDDAAFKAALYSADTIVCHNAKFDAHQIWATWGVDIFELAEVHDTDLMSRILLPEGQRGGRGGHGLKTLARALLDPNAADEETEVKAMMKSIGVKKSDPGSYREVWKAYPDVLNAYALKDTRYTYDLWVLFTNMFKKEKRLREVYELERHVLPILVRAERRGVGVDRARVTDLRENYRRRVLHLHDSLVATLGHVAVDGAASEYDDEDAEQLGQTAALREALQAQGLPLHRKTRTGLLSTSKFALQEFADDYPVIADLQNWRMYSKFLATYLDPMADTDVVHCSFNQARAWTGRMSCSSPNMQNIPRGADGVRSVFVPREGYVFVACDYDSIEMRLLAYYFGDPEFRRRVHEEDPHAWMAAQVHGGIPEDYAKGSPQEHRRTECKNVQFAIAYGAGAPRVSDMTKLPTAQAKQLISKIKANWPGYYRLNDRIRAKIKRAGYVNTILGRKQVVAADKSYVGLNALVQGSAADALKQGIVFLDELIRADEWDAHMVLFVHDEVICEVREDQAESFLPAMQSALEAALMIDPPLTTTGHIGRSYGDAK